MSVITKTTQAETFKKLGNIERELQALKVSLLFGGSFPKDANRAPYKEKDILKEAKRIRRVLWNERYSKSV